MTGTRGWIERVVGPRLDAVLARIDRSVAAATHVERAHRILDAPPPDTLTVDERPVRSAVIARARADLSGEPPPEPVPASDSLHALLDRAFRGAASEGGESERLAHTLALAPGAVRLGRELTAIDPPPNPESWRAAGGVAARVATGLTASAVPEDRARSSLARILSARAPTQWFLRRGTLYGSSSLLRGLIRLAPGDPELSAKTRQLCERLLRHVEVRREYCLGFREEGLPPDAHPPLERSRFALALLEAGREWADLRYVNAALKLSDWRHWQLAASGAADDSISLAHAVCIASQERVLRELLER